MNKEKEQLDKETMHESDSDGTQLSDLSNEEESNDLSQLTIKEKHSDQIR